MTYKTLKQMLLKHGKDVMTLDEIKSLIMREIGTDARTIKNNLEGLRLTGLIKDIGNTRFKINLS